MAAPRLTRTWRVGAARAAIASNQIAPSSRGKAVMVGFAGAVTASGAWAQVMQNGWSGSPGGLTRDGSASNPRSWQVLQRVGGTLQWLWDYVGIGDGSAQFYFSPGGLFTGGAANARPTASDEIYMDAPAALQFWDEAAWDGVHDYAGYMNAMSTTDNKVTLAWLTRAAGGEILQTLWIIADLSTPPAGIPYPHFLWMCGTAPTIQALIANVGNNWGRVAKAGGGSEKAYATTMLMYSGGAVVPLVTQLNKKNDLTNEYPMIPFRACCRDPGPLFGPLGDLDIDTYATPTTGLANGDYLSLPYHDFKVHNGIALPWGLLLVTLTNPIHNAVVIDPNGGGPAMTYIEVVFDSSIDPTTLNSLTVQVTGNTTPVTGYSVVGGTSLRIGFTPAFAHGDQIVNVRITTGVKGIHGESLAQDYLFSFSIDYP